MVMLGHYVAFTGMTSMVAGILSNSRGLSAAGLAAWLFREVLRSGGCTMVVCLAVAPGIADARMPDLGALKLVFEDRFSDLSVSAHGPGTRWTAHTPWGGDFGDAVFADPQPGFPFSVSGAGLTIELRKALDGHWRSGLLASVDPAGQGFSQQYGYFEMRAKLPSGPGTWPAFWLDSLVPPGSPDASVEIDVIEHYGKFPAAYNSTVTVWPKVDQSQRRSETRISSVRAATLSERFHNYGVEVDREWIVFYLDGAESWRVRTPPEHKHPLMILVDLGLGGGWPIDTTPSPSYMYVEYIRAYAQMPGASPQP